MTWQYSREAPRADGSYTATDHVEPDADYEDYEDYGDVVYYEDSSRWRWVGGLAGVVLVLAVVGAIGIVRGGDSASTSASIVPSQRAPVLTPTAVTPPPSITTPTASLPPTTSLPPETVTTVTPPATTTPLTTTPPATTPPAASQTITYTVSGTRQPGDIVTVTYLDETGMPRTEFNVALPWTKTIVSGANALLNSVTAVSVASHLNCTITDANGQTVTSQGYNTIATSCNS
ncbi:MAG TPA: MmpS family transport accessory protein [Mycobacterium sp.]|nr:MmpS family transport accessory protein [Mycobacterium sp.]